MVWIEELGNYNLVPDSTVTRCNCSFDDYLFLKWMGRDRWWRRSDRSNLVRYSHWWTCEISHYTAPSNDFFYC